MNASDPEDDDIHMLAGTLMLTVSPLGIAANAYVFLSVLCRRRSRSSFLTLCASKAMFNLIVCFVFLVWCTPIAFNFSYQLPAEVGMALGNIVGGMIYVGGVFTQVLASVNRLIASFSIHLYNKLCTLHSTLVLLLLCWTGTFALAAIYFFNGIGYIFHEDVLIWSHDGQEVSIQAFEIVGFIVYASTGTMFMLNIVTFVKLIMLTKSNTVLSNTESNKRMKRNRVLFAQKVSQDCLYLVDMLSVQVLSGLLPYSWWHFLFFTFEWLLSNVIDGFVMIVFVKDLYDPIRKVLQGALAYFFPQLQKSNDLFKRRQSKMTAKTVSSSS